MDKPMHQYTPTVQKMFAKSFPEKGGIGITVALSDGSIVHIVYDAAEGSTISHTFFDDEAKLIREAAITDIGFTEFAPVSDAKEGAV